MYLYQVDDWYEETPSFYFSRKKDAIKAARKSFKELCDFNLSGKVLVYKIKLANLSKKKLILSCLHSVGFVEKSILILCLER